MASYIVRRIMYLVPVAVVVSVIAFSIIHFAPGDPVTLMVDESATPEEVEHIRRQLGLDKPFSHQLVGWFSRLVRGDLGESLYLKIPVTTALRERMEPTISLTVLAFSIMLVFGIPIGVIAAVRHESVWDQLVMVFSFIFVSVPNFWLGLLLIYFFAVWLDLLPAAGYASLGDQPLAHFRHMIMPAIALGVAKLAQVGRMTRSNMLDVLKQDYVRTAKAKGVPGRVVIYKHALRNAIIPTVTVLGFSLASLLGGAVIIEVVFALPGVGRLIVLSIMRRDFPIVQGALLVIAVVKMLVNLLIDLSYMVIDPRVRYG